MSLKTKLLRNEAVLINTKNKHTEKAMRILNWTPESIADDDGSCIYTTYSELINSSIEYFFADSEYNGEIAIDDLPRVDPQDLIREQKRKIY